MIKAGEFFLNLGVKSPEKALGAMGSVNKAMLDMKSNGIAAKAAVVGAIYALKRMIMSSAQLGTGLEQFKNLTGESTDALQRWQYAMMKTGVDATETESAIKSVQETMGKMRMNLGAPSGMAVLQETVGFDHEKASKTMYVMDKLRQYLKTDKDITRANQVAASFGLSPGVIQGMRAGTLELDKISSSKILSESTIARLAKVNSAWLEFQNTWKLMQARLVADFGLKRVDTLQNSLKFISTTTADINKLLKQVPALQNAMVAAGVAISAAWAPLTATVGGVIIALSDLQKYKEGRYGEMATARLMGLDPAKRKEVNEQLQRDMTDPSKTKPSVLFSPEWDRKIKAFFGHDDNWYRQQGYPIPKGGSGRGPQSDVNFNQQIYNYGVEGSDEIGRGAMEGVAAAVRQMGALTEAN